MLSRLEPFTATPEQVVDYDIELKKFAQQRSGVSEVDAKTPRSATQEDHYEDMSRGLVRFADFLAKQRQKKQKGDRSALLLAAKRQKVCQYYRQVREGPQLSLGTQMDREG